MAVEYNENGQKFNFKLLTMKKIFILLLIFTSCVSKNEKKQALENKNTMSEIILSESFEVIDYLEFKRNPAMDYFFTRKYRLVENQLFFYDGNNKLTEMSRNDYLLAKKIIDSLPKQVLSNKENLGHPTVMVDIPDWEINIYLKSKDTVFIASGDLPEYMNLYEKITWDIITKLDETKK